MVRRLDAEYKPPFELVDFFVLVETREGRDMLSEAMVKVRLNHQLIHTAGEGNGPVNALDNAMRKALTPAYPHVADIRLTDYKVRIVDEGSGTAAMPRVMIDPSDGAASWATVGSSTNIIEA